MPVAPIKNFLTNLLRGEDDATTHLAESRSCESDLALPSDYVALMKRFGSCVIAGYWEFGPTFTLTSWYDNLMKMAGPIESDRTSNEDLWWRWILSLDLLVFSNYISHREFLAWHRLTSQNPENWPVVLIYYDQAIPSITSVGKNMTDALLRWMSGEWSVDAPLPQDVDFVQYHESRKWFK